MAGSIFSIAPGTAIAPAAVAKPAATAPVGESSFAATLGNAIDAAGNAERAADDAAVRFATGDPNIAIDQVMIASEKASISLRYATALKNRAIEAYRELMNTPV